MIPYSKLNSQGNDFILVERENLKQDLSVDQIKHFSKRSVIGCDQFFIIDTSEKENVLCDVFNQDGSKACQCGNGLRATMLYLNRKYSLKKAKLIVCEIPYKAEIDQDQISINMGCPSYIEKIEELKQGKYQITREGLTVTVIDIVSSLEFSYIPLSIGNSHCIVFSPNCIDHMEQISAILSDLYNGKMNIGFIKNAMDFIANDDTTIDLIVNERGAGYTDSCGSGATAAAICMFKLYELKHETKVSNSQIRVRQKGGDLEIKKAYNPDEFLLIGPSSFDGDGLLE